MISTEDLALVILVATVIALVGKAIYDVVRGRNLADALRELGQKLDANVELKDRAEKEFMALPPELKQKAVDFAKILETGTRYTNTDVDNLFSKVLNDITDGKPNDA